MSSNDQKANKLQDLQVLNDRSIFIAFVQPLDSSGISRFWTQTW